MAESLRRIVAAVRVPVSADVEDGFGPTPGDVAATARAVLDAGAVGINLEDRPGGGSELFTVTEQQERIAAARAVDGPLWINARTDVYLAGIGDPEERLALTLARAHAYAAAGADSFFVPGIVDVETITALAGGPLPLNVMVSPGTPPVATLADLGVARISLGAGIAQAAYAVADQAARELFAEGTYTTTAGGYPYPRLNGLFSRTP
jgi:2-methylisocitrate lyase-like PEP mutase family enzyme